MITYYAADKNEYYKLMKFLDLKVKRGVIDILTSDKCLPSDNFDMDMNNFTIDLPIDDEELTVKKLNLVRDNDSKIVLLEIIDNENAMYGWDDEGNVINNGILFITIITCVEYNITVKNAKKKYLGLDIDKLP